MFTRLSALYSGVFPQALSSVLRCDPQVPSSVWFSQLCTQVCSPSYQLYTHTYIYMLPRHSALYSVLMCVPPGSQLCTHVTTLGTDPDHYNICPGHGHYTYTCICENNKFVSGAVSVTKLQYLSVSTCHCSTCISVTTQYSTCLCHWSNQWII